MPADLTTGTDLIVLYSDCLFSSGFYSLSMSTLRMGSPVYSHYTRSHVQLRVNPNRLHTFFTIVKLQWQKKLAFPPDRMAQLACRPHFSGNSTSHRSLASSVTATTTRSRDTVRESQRILVLGNSAQRWAGPVGRASLSIGMRQTLN